MDPIRLSLRRPITVLVLYLILILFGIVAVVRMRIELLPSIDLPEINVVIEYPGMPAVEVENLVTVKVENALASVEGVEQLSSTIQPEISRTTLRFAWGSDTQMALSNTRQAADAVFPILPQGVSYPLVELEYVNRTPVARIAIVPKNEKTLLDIADLARTEIPALLRNSAAIGSVRLRGAPQREIHVEVDPNAVAAAGLTVGGIATTVGEHIVERPLGTVQNGTNEELVMATTDTRSLAGLERVPLIPPSLTLGSVAAVRTGAAPRTAYYMHNGEEAIGLDVYGSATSGSLGAARAAERIVEELRTLYEADMEISLVESAAKPISTSLRTLLQAIGLGLGGALVVLLVSYRRISTVFIVVSTLLPATGAVLFAMYLADISLNLVSLAGIAIGVGMVFDNAIVVFDRLARVGSPDIGPLADAVHDVIGATVGSTITTVLVFLPVFFIPGVVGALFAELAFTLMVLVVISFVTSFTWIPALFVWTGSAVRVSGNRRSRVFGDRYRRYVRFTMRRSWLVWLVVLGTVGGLVFLIPKVPREVLPQQPSEYLVLEATYPPETRIDESAEAAREVGRHLLAGGAVQTVASGGYESGDLLNRSDPTTQPHRMIVYIRYPRTVSPRELAGERSRIGAIVIESGAVDFDLSMPVDPIVTVLGDSRPGRYVISATDRDTLMQRYDRLVREVESIAPGTEARHTSELATEIHALALDRDAMAVSDRNAGSIMTTLYGLLEGSIVGTIEHSGDNVDVRVRMDRSLLSRPEQLAALHIVGSDGSPFALSTVGRIETKRVPTLLHRTDRSPALHGSLLSPDGDESNFNAIRERVAATISEVVFLSESEFADSVRDSLSVFAIALALIFLSMIAQFESVRTAFVVFLILPISTVGSVAFLIGFGKSINLNSMIGLLVMFGTTVNSAILLAAAYRGRAAGRYPRLAEERLRPLFATVGTTAATLVPLLLYGITNQTLESHTAAALLGGISVGAVAVPALFPPLFAKRRSKRDT